MTIFAFYPYVCMGGMAIVKSETLDVLGTSIRSDLSLDDHVFNVSKEAESA